jgi:hypothetical protein
MKTVSYSTPLVQFEELDQTIKELLGNTANELAKETHFTQRQTKIDGAHFARALIFGWMANPDAPYSFLQQMLAISGCDASVQALEQRMTPQGADFLLSLLHALMYACVTSDPVMTEILTRFEGVYLQDGTIIGLPNELEPLYKGAGGNTSTSGRSALRMQVRLNLNTGQLDGPWTAPAVACERKGAGSQQEHPLPANALDLTDSAYITLAEMKEHEQCERWWASHARSDWRVTDSRGVSSTLPEFVKKREEQAVIDEWVWVGSKPTTRQFVRLVAFRVSDEQRKKQEARVNKNTKRRAKGCRKDVAVGKKHQVTPAKAHRSRPSRKRRALMGWTVLLTNVAQERLSAHEVRVLVRSRWQIELLWRLWKERGQIDIWRSEKSMRVMCEVYAKVIGCVIQHWVILTGCWHNPHRSMVKASQIVPALAAGYVLSWSGPLTSADILAGMGHAMKRSQLNCRPNRLSTAQLLEQPSRSQALN